MRRRWQAAMIGLACSPLAKNWAQNSRAGTALATRYVAGTTAEQGVTCAADLWKKQQLHASLFYLGEYVDTLELVAENVAAKLAVAKVLAQAELDVHVSVDPTQIGHQIDPMTARGHAFEIAQTIARVSHGQPGVHLLMLDMEDQSVTDATLALHRDIRAAGLPVAVTLQAYLRRTEADLQALIEQGASVRLVKGAFVAGPDTAYTSGSEIKTASRNLIDQMLSKKAKSAGFKPIFATHDAALQQYASQRAQDLGWRKGLDYEFEMLLGVRGDLAVQQAARGERVRLYLPFGSAWWPHAMRRIGENPANALLLARSLISG
jgi:proline dehydrogenase